MRRFRLSVKLTLSFMSVAMIVLLVGLFGIKGEMDLRHNLLTISQESLPGIVQLNRLNLVRVQIRAQTFEVKSSSLWTPELRLLLEQVMRQRAASWREVDDALGQYEKLPQAAVEKAVFAAFQAEYTKWRQGYRVLDKLMEGMAAAANETEFAPLYQEYARNVDSSFLISDRVGVLIESLVALRNQDAARHASESLSESGHMVTATGIGILFGLVLAATLGILITRGTLRQLGGDPAEVVAVVNQIAEGDLTVRIAVRPGDTGSLLAAFARMVGNMRRLLNEVAEASLLVATAAEQLSVTSDETREQVSLQQSETDQVATAMNQMTAAVEEVARHASAAARAARDTDQETDNGGKVVAQTIDGIESLAHEVESAGQVILRLSDDSKEIGAVLDVIRGVAEQTNLLALNAAIEAARAGEQGRGFAVVAAEVRTLASRTQSSIQDIQEKIERVQKGSADAVQVMNRGQARARESVGQAQLAGSSLQAINGAIAGINDMNRQIASAAEEQTAVAEEINRNIHAISSAVQRTSAGSNRIAEASDQLAGLARQLQERIAQFRV